MTTAHKGKRKTKIGSVISSKMDKTVVVRVERSYRHPLYGKVVRTSKKYYAHNDQSEKLQEGDKVLIEEARPYSKLKRWRVVRGEK